MSFLLISIRIKLSPPSNRTSSIALHKMLCPGVKTKRSFCKITWHCSSFSFLKVKLFPYSIECAVINSFDNVATPFSKRASILFP